MVFGNFDDPSRIGRPPPHRSVVSEGHREVRVPVGLEEGSRQEVRSHCQGAVGVHRFDRRELPACWLGLDGHLGTWTHLCTACHASARVLSASMTHASAPIDPLASHGRQALSGATGRTLSLLAVDQRSLLPSAASPVQHFHDGTALTGIYESVVSVGQLGLAEDLVGLLGSISGHSDENTLVYFCEPTRLPRSRAGGPPNDVTTTLWSRGFTVVECRRERVRVGVRRREYCWGRARLTPAFAPPRSRQNP